MAILKNYSDQIKMTSPNLSTIAQAKTIRFNVEINFENENVKCKS